jgi:undecaprenyl-diphosphatase
MSEFCKVASSGARLPARIIRTAYAPITWRYNLAMIRRGLLQKEISRRLSNQLGFAMTVGLLLGLLASLGVILIFAELVEEVVEGESRRFDTAVLLWIGANAPDWLYWPMRVATSLGYYWVVLPLLVVAAYAFWRAGARISATLLTVSAGGSALLTTVLKTVFERARPDLFDRGVVESSYSFPSGHATVAVGFYGTLALLLAWRASGWRRWTIAAAGILLVLLIGFSRLYLGVHYPTDVLAGFLAAPLWVCSVGLVYLLWRLVRGPTKKGAEEA